MKLQINSSSPFVGVLLRSSYKITIFKCRWVPNN